ncbi:MAG: HD-GYP domain-containing protein [Deltaproteobacteria bacterium]|nr:HD-GYP domain-containing protein [Deltaproteobacteria bacterium]
MSREDIQKIKKRLNFDKQAIIHIYRICKLLVTHEPDNEIFSKTVHNLLYAISKILEQEGVFSLLFVKSDIYLNKARIQQNITSFSASEYLIKLFISRNIGGFEFYVLPDSRELLLFFYSLIKYSPAEGVDAIKVFEDLLELSGIRNIRVLPTQAVEQVIPDEVQVLRDYKKKTLVIYQSTIRFLKDALSSKDYISGIDMRNAKRLVNQMVDLSGHNVENFSFWGLSAIKNFDEYTFNHSVNVCVLAIAFGNALGLPKRRLAELGLAALFHDIGKLTIPKKILNKPGQLTSEEWDIMKQHPLFAMKLLFNMHGYSESGLKKVIVALQHHMNYDFSGYPRLILEKKLHLFSRIVAIVDTFDAMTTDRVYQKALKPDDALRRIISLASKKYDPVLVKAFVSSIGLYPPGTLVELSDGSIAVVLKSNPQYENIERPIIKIINSPSERLKSDIINLAETQSLQIRKSLDPEEVGINTPHYLFNE